MNAIFQLLNPTNTISVNRPLAHAIGLSETVIYGALISKWHYYAEHGKLDDGWFYSTAADLEESTSLTERQQKRCIDNLVALGLIKCEKRQMPAKRGFYIIDDITVLEKIIADGEEKMQKIKPQSSAKIKDKIQRREQKKADENTDEPSALPCSDKTSEQVPTKSRNKCIQNVDTCSDKMSEQHFNKSKYNKSNIINLSSAHAREENPKDDDRDRIDLKNQERDILRQELRNKINIESISEKEKAVELIEIIVDVICSSNNTVRVNGENVPKEIVKDRLLSIDNSHIEYVLSSIRKHNGKIRNIRAYLITALYNAPTTLKNSSAAITTSKSQSSFDEDEVFEQIKARYKTKN